MQEIRRRKGLNGKTRKKREHDEYDSPWKDILNRYFPNFLEFFFPEIAKEIDWSKGYEFLDKELEQITPESAVTSRTVDKLVKVWKKPKPEEGKGKGKGKKKAEEARVLIHVEVQAQDKSNFDERMYIYNNRLYELYRWKVASLAILADEKENWRPNEFSYELWGTEVKLKFPIAKLLDYKDKWDYADASRNPFAVVVMAHLRTQETRHNPARRLEFKWQLIRSLYERGYSKEDVRQLFRFIDWIMKLPKELARSFKERITEYEEEQKMRYITSIERLEIEEGILQSTRENLMEVLQSRFQNVSLPESLVEMLKAINDSAILKRLFRQSLRVESVPAFLEKVAEVTGGNGLESQSTALANG